MLNFVLKLRKRLDGCLLKSVQRGKELTNPQFIDEFWSQRDKKALKTIKFACWNVPFKSLQSRNKLIRKIVPDSQSTKPNNFHWISHATCWRFSHQQLVNLLLYWLNWLKSRLFQYVEAPLRNHFSSICKWHLSVKYLWKDFPNPFFADKIILTFSFEVCFGHFWDFLRTDLLNFLCRIEIFSWNLFFWRRKIGECDGGGRI